MKTSRASWLRTVWCRHIRFTSQSTTRPRSANSSIESPTARCAPYQSQVVCLSKLLVVALRFDTCIQHIVRRNMEKESMLWVHNSCSRERLSLCPGIFQGSSVIRMMKHFLGEETFRWGLWVYLCHCMGHDYVRPTVLHVSCLVRNIYM